MKPIDWSTTGIFFACIYLWFLSNFPSSHAHEKPVPANHPSRRRDETHTDRNSATPNKLLVIMLDGFRWDYFNRHRNELSGFSKFLSEGVQVKWVVPGFPAVSYPSWTTISTGVRPEVHGIMGNYMYDHERNVGFALGNVSSTTLVHWWQNAEPIWTTATRFKKRSFLRHWNRCDVPFNGIKIEECTGYFYVPGLKAVEDSFKIAVKKLKQGFDLVMVYGGHIDNVGHEFGPYSEEMRQALRDVDNLLSDFNDEMVDSQLDDKVNIIIVSDHGMHWTGNGSGTVYVNIEDYLKESDVFKIMGSGAVIQIAPHPGRVNQVYNSLKGHKGFTVYRKEEIPDEYHYKKGRLVQEIIVVADPKYYVRGSDGGVWSHQDPPVTSTLGGTHGYANMTDMRNIFFAKGPDFKKGIRHDPIEIVDIYQVFAHLLHVQAQPHNGSWDKVASMLTSKAPRSVFSNSHFILTLAVTFFTTISVNSHIFLPCS